MFPDPLPPKQNSPLRIVRSQPDNHRPSYRVRTNMTPMAAVCDSAFSVTVEEPDLQDVVRAQWYIDRGQDSVRSVQGGRVYAMGSSARIVTAPQGVASQLTGLIDGREHLLEVFVTDGEFTDVDTADRPSGVLPDGGALVDTAYVDSYLWLVTVQLCQ